MVNNAKIEKHINLGHQKHKPIIECFYLKTEHRRNIGNKQHRSHVGNVCFVLFPNEWGFWCSVTEYRTVQGSSITEPSVFG